ncbi:hypothetical protein [uncultured Tenacibaculum sp.]|uniref:hypothetical protein n=1 Tax=uncultured Tenacibaculum sp. TaxID=174713 RepID=UPI0026094011|nr:hypothetical protein [uncultured Tenacibaculum sp.]
MSHFILHTVNIFLIVLHFDFKVNFLGNQIFDIGVILLAILLAGLHYVLVVKRKAFPERVKKYQLIHLNCMMEYI